MKTFPKVSLGLYPTPIYKLENMSRELGTNIYVKRDDLCGIALGGNKVRKLEFLLKDAMDQGYDLVMTTGQAQSNHAMLTAACCRKLGLDCVLVLKKRGVTERVGNQILNHLMDTEVIFMDTDSYDDIYEEMDKIAAARGRKVYKIPCGGSNGLGSIGYVEAIKEIRDQIGACAKESADGEAAGMSSLPEHFDYIACACGSGGTAAGIAAGSQIYLPETKVLCPMVDTDPFEEIVPAIMKDTFELLEAEDEEGRRLEPVCPELFPAWGDGYSIPSEEGNEAIRLMMQLEGILLDTCYTGKAFGGIVKKAREGFFKSTDHVLFVHTGGAGGLFAQKW